MLAWLCDFIEKTVIPAVNNNAEALEEVEKALVELKEYVDNYFESSDFQEMINNKLDEMAEDGTLGELIGQYIDENYVTKTTYASAETGGAVKVGETLTIDENGVLNEKPYKDFLDGVELNYTRYQGRGGYTDVWYAIIPHTLKPRLGLADGVVNHNTHVANISHDNKATLAINAGVHRLSDKETIGGLVVDGEFIQDNNGETYAQYRELLYMTEAGRIDVLPYDSTEVEIMSVDPDWAVQGFSTYIYNYMETERVDASSTDYTERTIIGQDGEGNYLIFVTAGRAYLNVGFNSKDCCEFASSLDFNARILYNLDGGGSSQAVYRGITMSSLAGDTGIIRNVPNALYWASETAKNDGIFDAALTTNDAIIAERKKDVTTNIYNQLDTENENVNIGSLKSWIDGQTVYIGGQFTISTSTLANYGTICTNLPIPDGSTDIYGYAISTTDGAAYRLYLNHSNGKLNNGSGDAMPTETFNIQMFYRIKPSKNIDSTLDE